MENKRLFGMICCIQREMERHNNLSLASFKISAVQARVLIFIAIRTCRGEKVCQKDVENEIRLRASSVSTLLANLEKQGYIQRMTSEEDARLKYLVLTQQGDELCRLHKKNMEESDYLLQEVLNEEEQSQLQVLLEKVIEKIKNK